MAGDGDDDGVDEAVETDGTDDDEAVESDEPSDQPTELDEVDVDEVLDRFDLDGPLESVDEDDRNAVASALVTEHHRRQAAERNRQELLDQLDSFERHLTDVEATLEETEELHDRVATLRERTVHTAAVERVLLEIGLEPDRVEDLLEAIEEIDQQVWGPE